MLRPSTPLTGLYLVAFILLLLSSLSAPVIKSIALAEYEGYHFGVWGFCKDDGTCSPFEIGYTVEEIAPTRDGFNVNADTRHSVSYILIVHPIAALFTLICLCLAVFSHLRAPSHSARYQLGMFLMSLPTLLFSLLAFLVDVLLFIPHLKWGGYLVLAATIVLLIASIISCAMRRTLVSRKAQRKRIAENAEMSGENYFNRQAVKATVPRVESPPPLSGNSISPLKEKAAGFGAFEVKSRPSMDDQRPLNPPNSAFRPMGMESERTAYNNSPMNARRDPFDNPTSGPYGPGGARGMNSSSSLRSNGMMGGPMPYRGRGGSNYGAPRGYPSRGGSRSGRGRPPPGYQGGDPYGRGPAPQGWNGNGPSRGGMGPGMGMAGRGNMMGRRPPQGYDDDIDPYYGNTPDVAATNSNPAFIEPGRSDSPSPPLSTAMPPIPVGMRADNPRNPNPLTDATELDKSSPPPLLSDQAYVPPRAQWNDKALPQNVPPGPSRLSPIQGSPITLTTSSHVDALDAYLEDVDPRFAPDTAPLPGTLASSNTFPTTQDSARADPLPTAIMAGGMAPHADLARSPPPASSSSSDNPLLVPNNAPYSQHQQYNPQSNIYAPRRDPYDPSSSQQLLRPPPVGYDPRTNHSYDSLPLQEGQRSPAHSDGSHYTSISQRGINPAWRPGFAPKGPGSARSFGRRQGPSREEILLDTNPDFSLPPGRGGFAGSRARSRGRGNAGIGPGRAGSLPGEFQDAGQYPMPMQGSPMDRDGRYPTPI